MDNKLTMLKYVEYCTDKREDAFKECAKYNGFTSQASETMRENNLDYMHFLLKKRYVTFRSYDIIDRVFYRRY